MLVSRTYIHTYIHVRTCACTPRLSKVPTWLDAALCLDGATVHDGYVHRIHDSLSDGFARGSRWVVERAGALGMQVT